MDFESLFAQTRWQILSLIANSPLSPLEISKKLPATISHVSQQLKFLEALGIVKKEKLSNRDKGKPRMIFSLARDYGHFSILMRGFSGKKLVSLSEHQKTIIKIWFLENNSIHRRLERFYWDIEEHLKDLRSILSDVAGNIVVVADDSVKAKFALIAKKYSRDGMSCSVVNERAFARSYSHGNYSVFFGDDIIKGIKEVEDEDKI